MDTTPEPPTPVEEFVNRAERLASGAEHHVPSWLRPGDPESRLPVLFALDRRDRVCSWQSRRATPWCRAGR